MKKKYLALLVALTAVYAFFVYDTPVNHEQLAKYHLSTTADHWLLASVVVLLFLIWFAAVYGFSKFKDYAETIKTRQDGHHLAEVAVGLGVLAFGLVISSVLSSALQDVSVRNIQMVPRTVIIQNYISLVIAGVSYYLIYKGAKQLAGLVKEKPKSDLKKWWFWAYLVLAVVYVYSALNSSDKNTVATTTKHGLFYLPDALLLVTLLLPYVVVWYLGIRGPIYLAFYQNKTKGTIYKSALRSLSTGLMIVVLLTILTQFLSIVAVSHSDSLANASLDTLLVIIYVLIGLIAAGFLVIARGAKKLKLIEEV
ncbi:MAG TPA: hypothetical protein VHB51_01200 [Candidatus Saccharimonadales bacterium]|nr:hypothetical protein [Candidatus Saccharimonadales bacterium]